MRTPPPTDYQANYVPPHGPTNAQVYIVGEAPGKHENNMRRPFVGDAGQELDKLYLPRAGLRRAQVRVHNCYPYRPPDNRDPLPSEIQAGMPELLLDIAQCNPRVIIAMGRFAVAVFKGCSAEDVNMEYEHGVVFEWNGRVVAPTYHPALGLHQPRQMNFLLWDWERVRMVVQGQLPTHSEKDIQYGPLNINWWQEFANMPLAIDTETVDGKPWMIQVSPLEGVAYYCLTDDPVESPVFKEWIESAPLVILHNSPFDLNVLEQCGVHPKCWVDSMQSAYLTGNEHQGLKTLAYKHLGVRMQTYQEVIRPSTLRRAREYLGKIADQTVWTTAVFRTKKAYGEYKKANGVKTLTEEFRRMETKEWECTWEVSMIPDPDPVDKSVGKQIKTTQPTNVVKRVRRLLADIESDPTTDPVARWSKMESKDDAVQRFGDMPEGALDDIPLEDAVAYACADADMTLRLYNVLQPRIEALGLQDVLDVDMQCVPYILDMQRYGMRVDADALRTFGDELDTQMRDLDMRIQVEMAHKGVITADETFNPNSADQVNEALAKYGISTKSTEIKYLEPYAHSFPWIADHIAYKHLGKLRSTYVEGLLSCMEDDGRIRARFNLSRTDTGRLSSSSPNFQNIPVRSRDGHRIRECFVPEPGWAFVAIDYSQIEMRIAAHMSQDTLMLRVFRDGLDIHGETSDRIFGDRSKEHRYAVKRVGFGVMYGISGIGLKELFESEGVTGRSVEECDRMIANWFSVYTGVRDMMSTFQNQARKQGWVRGMFGRIYWVPEAVSTIERIASGGVRKAGNAPIQGGAQGVIKRAMGKLVPVYRRLNVPEVVVKPVNQVHDELLFEARDAFVTPWVKIATPIMENVVKLDVPVLCDVEVSDKSWGDCKEVGSWKEFEYYRWKEVQCAISPSA